MLAYLTTFLIVSLTVVTKCACSPREERFWPLNNKTHEVDLGQSSPFGPRLKISEGSRYDFHRGVDIPAPYLTEVYAIDDGNVRIPGPSHPSFSDGVIQLVHTGWEDEGDVSKKYYSTYIHLNDSFLKDMDVGDFVPKGTLIGLTGDTTVTSFPHLHFEIRAGSLFQGHACNPWRFLPCSQCSPFRANVTLSVGQMGENCSITAQASVPPDQLTFVAIQLEVSGAISEFNRTVDLCEDNIFYTNNPSYDPLRLDDNTFIPDLVINPHFFNSRSFERNQWSAVDYVFLNLPAVGEGGMGIVTATVYDVFGEVVFSDPLYYSSSCSRTDPPTTPTTEPGTTNPPGTDDDATTDNQSGTGSSLAMVPSLVTLLLLLLVSMYVV